MIPLLHDLSGETVLVFGGGRVGARRARTFAEEADVVVVSPAFSDSEFADAECVRAAPTPDEVADWLDRVEPVLVVAATDDEAVNGAVATAARERGVLVNRADRSGERDPLAVAVPSIVRDGDVVVGISTGVPALTTVLRERVEATMEHAGAMAALAADVRRDLRDRAPPEKRREAIRRVVRSESIWTGLGTARAKAEARAASVVDDVVRDT